MQLWDCTYTMHTLIKNIYNIIHTYIYIYSIYSIKCMALRSWAKLLITLSQTQAVKERHGQTGSTLEMDSGHKNNKNGPYSKSLRPFPRILYVVDTSIYVCRGNFCARREHAFGNLASLRSQLIILIRTSFLLNKQEKTSKTRFQLNAS